MKKCTKCQKNKDIFEFGIHKSTKDKLQTQCKQCIKENRLKFKLKNPNWDSEHYLKNKEHYKEKSKDRYQNNKKDISIKQKEYNLKNKDKIQEYYKKWQKENKSHINEYFKKRKLDPKIKLSSILRSKISTGIKKFSKIKNKKTLDIVGLDSWEEFKIYIENQFLKGMNWDNYGLGKNNSTWHIDHIIPLSSAISVEDIYKLNHYTNLRPMWGSDNIRKGRSLFEE